MHNLPFAKAILCYVIDQIWRQYFRTNSFGDQAQLGDKQWLRVWVANISMTNNELLF